VILTAALELLAAVPVGWVSALAARRLAGSAYPPVWLMILIQAALAGSAILLAPAPAVPVLLVAGWGLGLLAVIDVLAFRLPDIVTAPLGLLGLVLAPRMLGTPLSDHLIGAAGGYAVFVGLALAYARLRGRDGLGLGDAKLLAVAGAWLGWESLPATVVLASAGGLAWAALRLVQRGRAGLSEPIAFGAPLCAAIWISLLLAARGPG